MLERGFIAENSRHVVSVCFSWIMGNLVPRFLLAERNLGTRLSSSVVRLHDPSNFLKSSVTSCNLFKFNLSPSRPRWFWWMESNADRFLASRSPFWKILRGRLLGGLGPRQLRNNCRKGSEASLFRRYLGPRPPDCRPRNNFSKWRQRGKKTTQQPYALDVRAPCAQTTTGKRRKWRENHDHVIVCVVRVPDYSQLPLLRTLGTAIWCP